MPFCFIHIPKNAGRAFANTVIKHTGVKASPHKLMADYFRKPTTGYEFFGGHTFYQTLRQMLPTDTCYMTLLRDPINAIYSHWKYLVDTGGFKHYGINFAPTFSQFIRLPETKNLAINFQCRYLTMTVPHPEQRQRLMYQLAMEKAPHADMADVALEALRDFVVVGTQERFDVAVKAACLAMGHNPPGKIHVVKKDYYSLIKVEDLKYLMAVNDADWTVYNAYK